MLLREILAGAILLPAMDVIADPVSAYRDVKDDRIKKQIQDA